MRFLLACVMFVGTCLIGAPRVAAQEAEGYETVTIRSIDGLPITADLYETGDRRDPLIVLFHQSGSSRGEYRDVAPRLVAWGFNALAVDLRWGGTDRWNSVVNETAAAYGTPAIMAEAEAGNRERVWPTIFAAYQDMLAAFDWAAMQDFSGRTLVLGSSVSAMLVLKLPQDRPVDAVLSFSPGDYYDADSTLARSWSQEIDVPVYVAGGVEEGALTRPIYDAVASPRKTYHLAETGRHGASILLEDPANLDSLHDFLRVFQPPREVTFQTDDGVTIYGDLYDVASAPAAPILLLFHQGGSNARAEYGPFVDRLLEEGFVVLAIDQRTGGNWLGGTNRTVEAHGETDYSYCDAYPDLRAALRYVVDQGYTGARIVWGSSYSAALVFRLATEYPEEIDGMLAFSPASGEPMDGCRPEPYAADLRVSALALRPPSEIHVGYVGDQLDLFREHGMATHVPRNGVHGSSMLNARRVQGDVEPTWRIVLDFLNEVRAGT